MRRVPHRDELERIRAVYRERDGAPPRPGGGRSCGDLLTADITADVRDMLARHWAGDLSAARVLEVGCGSGAWLRILSEMGAAPSRLHGVDLMPNRVAQARGAMPDANWVLGSGDLLPYEDARFDLVLQFTVFSSVLDPDVRVALATEMRRVLRPGGAVLWYDFVLNPRNRNTVGLGRAEIARCFPGARVTGRRVTLAPPLFRRVAPVSRRACRALAAVPWLRTHYLALIQPPEA